MNKVIESFKQNRQIWAWAVVVCLFLILVGHAPVMPIIAGGVLAIVITSLRALSHGQKKSWQTGTQR